MDLLHTEYEWDILEQIAGGDERKLRFWLNANFHNMCDNIKPENSLIKCPECKKERRVFCIPDHLTEKFTLLMDRYKKDPATLINNYIIGPALFEKHFKIYGY